MDHQDWNERYRQRGLELTLEPNRFVADEAADLAPGRLLDLAAGEGRNAVWFATRGWEVTAVDFSDVALGRIKELSDHRQVAVVTVQADLAHWVPPPAAFDLVLISNLHLPEAPRREVVGRAAAAVAPGGRLLVVGRDRTNLEEGWGRPRSPEVQATAAEMGALLAELGLRVARAERVERPVDTPDGVRIALDHVVVGRRP